MIVICDMQLKGFGVNQESNPKHGPDSRSIVVDARMVEDGSFRYVIDARKLFSGKDLLVGKALFADLIDEFTLVNYSAEVFTLFLRSRSRFLTRTRFRQGISLLGPQPMERMELGTAFGGVDRESLRSHLEQLGYKVTTTDWRTFLAVAPDATK
jgi:hypothetical protein